MQWGFNQAIQPRRPAHKNPAADQKPINLIDFDRKL